MDINDLKKEKIELEQRILKIVNDELKEFNLKTGVYVESVNIGMRRLCISGEPFDRVVPIYVTCGIQI